MHTDWKVSFPQQRFEYAIEVARRQPDGTCPWLIGDPFTVGKRTASETKAAEEIKETCPTCDSRVLLVGR